MNESTRPSPRAWQRSRNPTRPCGCTTINCNSSPACCEKCGLISASASSSTFPFLPAHCSPNCPGGARFSRGCSGPISSDFTHTTMRGNSSIHVSAPWASRPTKEPCASTTGAWVSAPFRSVSTPRVSPQLQRSPTSSSAPDSCVRRWARRRRFCSVLIGSTTPRESISA